MVLSCRIRTEGICKRLLGNKLISFMMLDSLTGISLLKKVKDSSSVAVLPNSMNCLIVRGLGLN